MRYAYGSAASKKMNTVLFGALCLWLNSLKIDEHKVSGVLCLWLNSLKIDEHSVMVHYAYDSTASK